MSNLFVKFEQPQPVLEDESDIKITKQSYSYKK